MLPLRTVIPNPKGSIYFSCVLSEIDDRVIRFVSRRKLANIEYRNFSVIFGFILDLHMSVYVCKASLFDFVCCVLHFTEQAYKTYVIGTAYHCESPCGKSAVGVVRSAVNHSSEVYKLVIVTGRVIQSIYIPSTEVLILDFYDGSIQIERQRQAGVVIFRIAVFVLKVDEGSRIHSLYITISYNF